MGVSFSILHGNLSPKVVAAMTVILVAAFFGASTLAETGTEPVEFTSHQSDDVTALESSNGSSARLSFHTSSSSSNSADETEHNDDTDGTQTVPSGVSASVTVNGETMELTEDGTLDEQVEDEAANTSANVNISVDGFTSDSSDTDNDITIRLRSDSDIEFEEEVDFEYKVRD